MKKIAKKILAAMPSVILLAVYFSLPERIILPSGENVKLNFAMTAEAGEETAGSTECDIKLFNILPIKKVDAAILPERYVIPSGEAIGIRLYTEGVLVIDTGNVTDESGRIFAPAKKAGIKSGDRIISVNGKKIDTSFELKCLINEANGVADLEVCRDDKILDIPVSAVFSKEHDLYQIGLWVKDSAAGIGTLTFYDPQSSAFAALGHGICDGNTNSLYKIKEGTVSDCTINRVIKSEKGSPGELVGEFATREKGSILLNCEVGIYGKAPYYSFENKIPVASRFEMECGDAKMLCDIDGQGVKAYQIKITKIFKMPISANKSFIFKVTDAELIQNAGGVVQGMSGSPIIQNGKLVGAVTHVFVNDSQKGYGIFAENMLDITTQIK